MRAAVLALLLAVTACGVEGPTTVATVPDTQAPPLPVTTEAPPVPCLSLGVPAYVDVGALRSLAGVSGVRYVVVNPANGPDVERDEDLAAAVVELRAAGIAVLGYVHTSYGERSLATVGEEIGRYREWYAVDGIFVDETTNGRAGLPYYREVAAAIGDQLVVLNPGTPTDPGYDAIADVIVTFEDTWDAYRDRPASTRAPDVVEWHLVLDAGREVLAEALYLAAERGATIVDVTDLGREETWNRLPVHLAEQSGTLTRLNEERRCAA